MESWETVAAAQAGMISRRQLAECGVTWSAVHHRIARGRWRLASPTVIATTTGPPSLDQMAWTGVLHAGPHAVISGLSAAERHGLRHWQRDEIEVMAPAARGTVRPVAGIRFVKTSRDLQPLCTRRQGLPVLRIGAAVLLFAASQPSPRTAEGVVAAVVQQRLSTPAALAADLDQLRPLRHAALLRRALDEISGGAQSVAELDIRRLCRRFGLAPPTRQTKRRDAHGRVRYTDCEWQLADGITLVLEIDGAFHIEVAHWEDGLARQRALTTPSRIVVHCTARELRDRPERIARDLRALGVPLAA